MSTILSFIKKHAKMLIIILAAVLVVTGTTVGLVIGLSEDDPNPGTIYHPGFTPDYPAPPLEEGAEDVEDDEDKLDAPTGGGAVGMIYSNEVEIDLSDNKATLLFANPNRSTQNVSLQLIIQDQVVMETGLIQPSKRITQGTLKDGIAAQLPSGVYQNAKFLVRFYDPETNACSIVNSEIIVTVTVRE